MFRLIPAVFVAALMLAGCGATTSSMPLSEDPVVAEALPRTEADLRHLNAVHADIVRRAERQCQIEGEGQMPGREFMLPCIRRAVDTHVGASGDEALRAFHDALNPRERYDHRRSPAAWRWMVEE